jgi:DNA-binding XRE family transcriptional regulator
MAAAVLLGKSIRLGRKERKWSVQALADRAGISRGTLVKIEKGDLRCEIGLVFELAVIVGVRLFDTDEAGITKETSYVDSKIALLPKRVRAAALVVNDDF